MQKFYTNVGDKYPSLDALYSNEVADIDYSIDLLNRDTGIFFMAPHGGKIERGTSEIAFELAGKEHSYFSFNGLKQNKNRNLHVTSNNFRNVFLDQLLNKSNIVISFHGCKNINGLPDSSVIVGGRNFLLRDKIIKYLNRSDIYSTLGLLKFHATSEQNICNMGFSNEGVQIEITENLRKEMFEDIKVRDNKNEKFYTFISCVIRALSDNP